jgi:Rieske Fe-S protein
VLGLVAAPVRTASPHERRAGDDGWTEVARFDEVPIGEPLQCAVLGREVDAWAVTPARKIGAVWLLRGGEGVETLRALSAVCPHLGCLIERSAQGFGCPCHTSDFSLDGQALNGPSPRSMDPIDLRVREGTVEVRWRRYRLGVAERVEEG